MFIELLVKIKNKKLLKTKSIQYPSIVINNLYQTIPLTSANLKLFSIIQP